MMFVTAVNRVFINELRKIFFVAFFLFLYRRKERKAAAVTKYSPSRIDDLEKENDEKVNY
jgi:hypothetical protein